jgi:hypothetical protein
MKVPCAFCPYEVDLKEPGIWRLKTGWCQQRKTGGSNAIRLPKEHDQWAHNHCIDMETKQKISAVQEGMF